MFAVQVRCVCILSTISMIMDKYFPVNLAEVGHVELKEASDAVY